MPLSVYWRLHSLQSTPVGAWGGMRWDSAAGLGRACASNPAPSPFLHILGLYIAAASSSTPPSTPSPPLRISNPFTLTTGAVHRRQPRAQAPGLCGQQPDLLALWGDRAGARLCSAHTPTPLAGVELSHFGHFDRFERILHDRPLALPPTGWLSPLPPDPRAPITRLNTHPHL